MNCYPIIIQKISDDDNRFIVYGFYIMNTGWFDVGVRKSEFTICFSDPAELL